MCQLHPLLPVVPPPLARPARRVRSSRAGRRAAEAAPMQTTTRSPTTTFSIVLPTSTPSFQRRNSNVSLTPPSLLSVILCASHLLSLFCSSPKNSSSTYPFVSPPLQVAEGYNVSIKKFGTFKFRENPARRVKVPNSDNDVRDVPASRTPTFKASDWFKNYVAEKGTSQSTDQ